VHWTGIVVVPCVGTVHSEHRVIGRCTSVSCRKCAKDLEATWKSGLGICV